MIELAIILALILANGVFAMSEFAVVSARKALLEQRSGLGDKGAGVALDLANSPTRFLSTIQIGITLVGVLTGAFGGARVANALGDVLAPTFVGTWSDPVAFGIVVTSITYLTLIFGELLPKNLALRNPEGTAATLAPAMKFMSKAAAPAVWLLSISTVLLLRILGKGGDVRTGVTEEEIKAMVGEARETGIVTDCEARFILRVLRAADRQVREVMTPRVRVVWVEHDMTFGRFLEFNSRHYFSHVPVCDGDLDRVVGILTVADILETLGAGVPTETLVGQLASPPFYVPVTKNLLELVEEMRSGGHTVVLLVDEFGAVSGLATYKQLTGHLVGRMVQDGEEEAVRRIDENVLHLDGSIPIHDANYRLGLNIPDQTEYDTIGGFLMWKLGRIPETGDRVVLGEFEMEVTLMDGHRVSSLQVTRTSDAAAD